MTEIILKIETTQPSATTTFSLETTAGQQATFSWDNLMIAGRKSPLFPSSAESKHKPKQSKLFDIK